jgi:hypothetical protein
LAFLEEDQLRDAAGAGAHVFVMGGRLAGVGKGVPVARPEEQQVGVAAVDAVHARLPTGSGLCGEVLEADRLMPDCLQQSG